MSGKKDLTALTALKGIFCLVIALHNTMLIQFVFADVPGASFILNFGGTWGNTMFLTISGFLFAYSYRGRISNHEISFPVFLKRRLARLYPLYLLTNLAALVLNVVMYGPSAINLDMIASTVLMLDGNVYNTPTWFLSVLFVCYVLFYFICYHTRNSTQYFCAVAFMVALGATLESDLPFLNAAYCMAYLNFFSGCILAEVCPLLLKKYRTWLPHVCLLTLGAVGYLLLRYGVEIIAGDLKNAFSLVIAPLTLCIALSDSIYTRILQMKPLVFLGKISTSVYFWHVPLFLFFRYLLIGSDISDPQYLIFGALLLAGSVLSWRFIENPKKPAAR